MAKRSHLPRHNHTASLARSLVTAGLSIIGLTVPVPESQALDVVLDGNVNPAAEFNTNIFFSPEPQNQKAVYGEGLDGGFDLSLADSRWKTTATGRFQNRWYQGGNNLDYFNQLFSLKNVYLLSERSSVGLNANYDMDATVLAGLGGGVGFVFARIPRTTRSISPNWTYALTEKTRLALAYSYQDTEYDKKRGANQGVVDSVTHAGNLNLTHQWNEKLQLLGSLAYTSYDLIGLDRQSDGIYRFQTLPIFLPARFFSPGVTSTIRTASFMGGFSYTPTETVTLAFSGGGQHNETSVPDSTIRVTSTRGPGLTDSLLQPGVESSSFTEILSASASKRFERSELGFDFSRTVSPNLIGALIISDHYGFKGNYRFTPTLSSDTHVNMANITGEGIDQDHFNARTGVSWEWDDNWLMSASYHYGRIDFNTDSRTADSHALYFNIRYLFDKHQF
jgi:hypothetical protein